MNNEKDVTAMDHSTPEAQLEPCPLPEPLRTLAQECCGQCRTGTITNGYGICTVTPPSRDYSPSVHADNWTHHLIQGGGGYGCAASILYELNSRAPVAAPVNGNSGNAWREWFERLGDKATAEVVNATANLLINERLIALSKAGMLPDAAPSAPSSDARALVMQWREANEWPGLVWSAQNLSDELRWLAAWRDLEQRITTHAQQCYVEGLREAYENAAVIAENCTQDDAARDEPFRIAQTIRHVAREKTNVAE